MYGRDAPGSRGRPAFFAARGTCLVTAFIRQWVHLAGKPAIGTQLLIRFADAICGGIYSLGQAFSGGNLMSNWARIVSFLFFTAALQVFPTRIDAQQRGPSTPEERARAVQTAKSLQADPLAPNLQGDREWLVK